MRSDATNAFTVSPQVRANTGFELGRLEVTSASTRSLRRWVETTRADAAMALASCLRPAPHRVSVGGLGVCVRLNDVARIADHVPDWPLWRRPRRPPTKRLERGRVIWPQVVETAKSRDWRRRRCVAFRRGTPSRPTSAVCQVLQRIDRFLEIVRNVEAPDIIRRQELLAGYSFAGEPGEREDVSHRPSESAVLG